MCFHLTADHTCPVCAWVKQRVIVHQEMNNHQHQQVHVKEVLECEQCGERWQVDAVVEFEQAKAQ